jgi:hypothetical protein
MKTRWIFIAAMAASWVSTSALSQTEGKVEISDIKAEIATLSAGTKGCIAGSLKFSEGGHRWTVGINNSCGRVVQCEIKLSLKASNGQTGSGSCNPSVPPGNNPQVCSASSANVSWVSGSGTAHCR